METSERLKNLSIQALEAIKEDVTKSILPEDTLGVIHGKILNVSNGIAPDIVDLANTAFFVAEIFGMSLTLDDYKVPFKSYCTFKDGRCTLNLDHIDDEKIQIIKKISELTVDNYHWNARINDVLWVTNKNRTNAHKAIYCYIEIAYDDTNTHAALIAAERACQLHGVIAGDEPTRLKLVSLIQKNAPFDKAEPTGFLRFSWIEILLKIAKKDELEEITKIIDDSITESQKQTDWRKARKYVRLNIKISGFRGDDQKMETCKQLETDLYVMELEHSKKHMPPQMLQHLYTKAITACSNVKGRKEQRKVLLNELLDIQLEIPGTLQKMNEGQNITEAVVKFREDIQEKTFIEALEHISLCALEDSKSKAFENTKKIISDYPLGSLFGKIMLDEKGKIITKSNSLSQKDIEAGNIRASVAENMRFSFLVSGGIVQNCIPLLHYKYRIRKTDLDELITDNPFIPTHRQYQFRDGIWNGLNGNWTESLYVLTPLIENSLREVMRRTGYHTVKIDADGVQREKPLTDFIYEKDFEEIFGEDQAFQLQVLLCDVNGMNLRNNVAHGLVTDGLAYSEYAAFLWAQAVQLCFRIQKLFYHAVNKPTESEV